MQNRLNSMYETVISVGVGYFIAFSLNLLLLPHFANDIANQVLSTALIIGSVYTGISMIRSYIFRRIFNKYSERYNNDLI